MWFRYRNTVGFSLDVAVETQRFSEAVAVQALPNILRPSEAVVSYNVANGAPFGPRICYAFVLSFHAAPGGNPTSFGSSSWWYPAEYVPSFPMPFRLAIFMSPGDIKTWKPRDTMAWWSDGTSNQILVGEKHLPPTTLNECKQDGSLGNSQIYYSDCSHLMGGGDSFSSPVARLVRASGGGTTLGSVDMSSDARTLARPDEEGNLTIRWTEAQFGSAHPNAVNFLLGDGAVRSFPLTTPAGILARLGTVNDGNNVSLP